MLAITADYIDFHAIERPDAAALVHHGRAITFAALSRDIRNFTQAVGEFKVPRGGSVAVGCDDLHIHWVLLLACERLGIATVSFISCEAERSARELAHVDLTLSEAHFPAVGAPRHHLITREWVSHVLALDADDVEHLPPPSAGDLMRILRTSGTTGSAKQLAHSREIHDAWLAWWGLHAGLCSSSRLLLTLSFTANGMYACAAACLRAGGTVVSAELPGSQDIARAISDYRITAIILVPIQIATVLDALPDNFVKPPSLTVYSFGAAVFAALRRRALALLATEVIDLYGSNETGFISSMRSSRDDGISALWPGVRIEIVDEWDAPLPHGEAGRIRVKTAEMVQGYLGNPDATSRMFKDGWFYPGDLGILHGSRRLEILGRGDDLLNLGGRKVIPEALERAILKRVTPGDIGVCSAPNAEGIDELFVGIAGAECDDRELEERLSRALASFLVGRFHPVRLPSIPRNANGKIQRDLLRNAIADAHGLPRKAGHS